MMKKVFLGLFYFILLNAFSQKQANIWYFGQNAGLDFNSGSPVALTNGALYSLEGCATMCDNSGSLLFYTEGTRVYNKNHALMPNSLSLNGNISSTQSSIIIQKPGSANIYYIFTAALSSPTAGLCYSEVDMTLAGGLGGVTAVKNVLLHTSISEKVTAVRHQNGVDIWIITNNYTTNTFYAYLVSAAGVTTTPIVSTAGSIPTHTPHGYGYLKASPDAKYLAQAISLDSIVDVLKFNSTTGSVNTWFSCRLDFAYGIEFSMDASKLYVSSDNRIIQLDLSSNSPSSIISSTMVVGYTTSNYSRAIQLGPDNKIYIAGYNDPNLSCISLPNALGLGCGFNANGVSLGGMTSMIGLPNFITSYFNTGAIIYSNVCAGSPTNFSIDSTKLMSVSWNFGDPSSGSNNSSTTYTTTHLYSATGSYSVSAITVNVLGDTTTLATVLTIINPGVALGNDSVLCPLNSIVLSASGNYTACIWQNGSTLNSQTITSPGKYWVTATNQCGSASDTILIDPLIMPVSNIADTVICETGGLLNFEVKNETQFSQQYLWNDSATSQTHEITQVGVYWVDISNVCGTIRDSIIVESKNCEIIIPNVLTPNGDNKNDVFVISGLEKGVANVSILNRWGINVYDSKGYNNDWSPKNLNDGVYFYIIYYPVNNKTYKGFISLFGN